MDLLPFLRSQVSGRVWDADAAEDVVQNVLLSIHRARHTYRPERRLLPWLRAVARNAVLDHLRDRRRRGARETELLEEELAAAAEEPPFVRGELSPRVAAALEELPAAQRQAVQLLQLEGLTVVEAAARVGITPTALKVRAHRGYRSLRERLGSGDP
jgi:RNA polymerase sigma-70 factor (ECF subfamily)